MIIESVCNKYSVWDIIKLMYFLVITKLIYPRQRIIRRPFTIRGGKMIDWGKKLTTVSVVVLKPLLLTETVIQNPLWRQDSAQ